MAKSEDHSQKYAGSKAHQGTKKVHSGHRGIEVFKQHVYSVNTFHLLAGFGQLCLGLIVVFISVVGLIRPFWLSIALTIVASISITTGIYLCYRTVAKINDDNLLRDAMRRIVEDQN